MNTLVWSPNINGFVVIELKMYLTQTGLSVHSQTLNCFIVSTYHHLVTEFVIKGVGEETSDRCQSVDHIERQTAIVSEHHQQGPHVRMNLIHLDSSPL